MRLKRWTRTRILDDGTLQITYNVGNGSTYSTIEINSASRISVSASFTRSGSPEYSSILSFDFSGPGSVINANLWRLAKSVFDSHIKEAS